MYSPPPLCEALLAVRLTRAGPLKTMHDDPYNAIPPPSTPELLMKMLFPLKVIVEL